MASPARLSGLQRQVLALYRSVLREAARKDRSAASNRNDGGEYFLVLLSTDKCPSSPPGDATTTSYARSEFRKKAASIPRNDFRTIEHMIRWGQKQIKLLRMPGVSFVGSPNARRSV
uniref:Uncharacterized protein n=1 Tax=Trieres chinensis TaxID=1514140 RepID=A0A7S1ZYE5_TRICV|mmetsp:Transcript_35777/g.73163  ORF Transcript_35777/g.73163 Transcript_35777/m.73163 type:complete len:117 (+) Transcript_35777:44-394(+)